MARITPIALVLLAAGCAAGARPVQFPSRGTAAVTTQESDDALLARGYVFLGPLEVSVEKERCTGTAEKPGPCQRIDPTTDSTSLLLAKASERGADLVRIARHGEATTAPWTSTDCDAFGAFARGTIRHAAVGCIPTPGAVIGVRRLVVSTGVIWRHEPALVPNELLARATEAGDEARVAEALPRVTNLDAYLAEPPLVIAARKGHPGILRRLLSAGARAGKDAALRAAVARSDLGMTEQLLAAGARADARDPESLERPLHVAATSGASRPILERLLAAGADLDALDASDRMPVQGAIVGCHVETAQFLIGAGANTRWALADGDLIALARERCPAQVDRIVQLMATRR